MVSQTSVGLDCPHNRPMWHALVLVVMQVVVVELAIGLRVMVTRAHKAAIRRKHVKMLHKYGIFEKGREAEKTPQ